MQRIESSSAFDFRETNLFQLQENVIVLINKMSNVIDHGDTNEKILNSQPLSMFGLQVHSNLMTGPVGSIDQVEYRISVTDTACSSSERKVGGRKYSSFTECYILLSYEACAHVMFLNRRLRSLKM